MNPAFTLDSTYIHLRPDESALAMEGGAAFWQGIEERHDLDHGRLMGSTDQSRPTGTTGSAIPPATRS